MFDKKTVLVCSVLLMIGAAASGPELFPLIFMISVTGMVSVIAIPIVTGVAALIWHVALKHPYNRIQNKNGKALYRLIFAPPKKYM